MMAPSEEVHNILDLDNNNGKKAFICTIWVQMLRKSISTSLNCWFLELWYFTKCSKNRKKIIFFENPIAPFETIKKMWIFFVFIFLKYSRQIVIQCDFHNLRTWFYYYHFLKTVPYAIPHNIHILNLDRKS